MAKKKKKLSVRQKAARRTVAGGFNKAVFKKIGGKDFGRAAPGAPTRLAACVSS